jgi:hypothetical protein
MTKLTVAFFDCFTKTPKNEAHILYDSQLGRYLMAIEIIKQNGRNCEELLYHVNISELEIIHSLEPVRRRHGTTEKFK